MTGASHHFVASHVTSARGDSETTNTTKSKYNDCLRALSNGLVAFNVEALIYSNRHATRRIPISLLVLDTGDAYRPHPHRTPVGHY